MRLSFLISLGLTICALTSIAMAADLGLQSLRAWPWWEIGLIAFPVISIILIRLAPNPQRNGK
ncbi:MAG: hypothetical protein HRU11_06465 [Parvularculaceae bacterium]|nr:hypothetical protein [Parvularculaceae bacterium]